ncbi:MAG: GTP cyclohydrolase II, partial [Actinomadura rubrobrunea]|nr:GTP cyclohydrolase II [Actinomadura rubrobrunea]
IKLITIDRLAAYRRRTEPQVKRVVETRLPNRFGMWRAVGFADEIDGDEHVALVYGDLGDGEDVLVRAHSECLTGDVLHSERCDCGTQLDSAMERVAAEGRGVILYLRGHEGRGIGLLAKLRAYALQDEGADTVDANLELGLPADARDYSDAAHMLRDLGVRSVRVLTNNPRKLAGLDGFGVRILGREPLPAFVTEHNRRYLAAKRDRLGHRIEGLPDLPASDGASGDGAAGGAAGAAPPRREDA